MGHSLLTSFTQLMKEDCKIPSSQIHESFYIYEPLQSQQKKLEAKGFKNIMKSESDVLKHSKIIFNCVKPHIIYDSIVNSIDSVTKDHMMVSIAAGVSINFMNQIYKEEFNKIKKKEISYENNLPKIVRVMTNHLCAIKQGGSVFCMSDSCDKKDEELINFFFNQVGLVKKIDESLMHAYTGLIGSGPAFVYYFIESLIDSALKNGIDVNSARQFATQTVMGAACFMDDTEDKSPNNIKYIVTTPKGTTIAGLNKLNEHRFKFTVDEAVSAACQRSMEIDKEKIDYLKEKYSKKSEKI